MANVGAAAYRIPVRIERAQAETEAATAPEPTAEDIAFAEQYPAGPVQLEKKGFKNGLRIGGAAAGLTGSILLGASLLGRGGAMTRPGIPGLALGGALVGAGALAAIGAGLVKPETRIAVASGLETRVQAQEYANKMTGRRSSVAEDVNGKWAVFDEGPLENTRGYSYGRDHRYGSGSYYDDYYREYGYYEPYYPGVYDYDVYYPGYSGSDYPWTPAPSYGGGTSYGDDYDYGYTPSYPSGGSSGGTSSGDDYSYDPPSYSPPAYDPPAYDPPSYDPPSYDPPSYSYDPPSYSYDPPSYDYGSSYGDSSSNGDPSYDDF